MMKHHCSGIPLARIFVAFTIRCEDSHGTTRTDVPTEVLLLLRFLGGEANQVRVYTVRCAVEARRSFIKQELGNHANSDPAVTGILNRRRASPGLLTRFINFQLGRGDTHDLVRARTARNHPAGPSSITLFISLKTR